MMPTPEEIKESRKIAKLSQTHAAQLIHSTLRTWQDWEAGKAKMHAGLWELFLLKVEEKKRLQGLKTKQLAVTRQEKALWDRLAELGCIACLKDGIYNPHVSIHHVDGRTKPGCHTLVLPLCGPHHQEDGSGTLAVHPWKARFEQRYGAQLDLVKQCMTMIGEA